MIDAVATRTLPRHNLLIRLAILALALVVGGSMLGTGVADAKRKQQRIVAVSPFAAATMAKLGGKKPIAIGATLGGDRRKPQSLRNVRVLPLSHPNGPNLEQLAKLRPDIVLSSKRWSKGTAAMKQLGIRVVYADPVNVGQTYPTVKRIGKITGRTKQANRLVKSMRRQIRSATGGFKSRPKVMLILGVGRTPYTFLGSSWGGQIIKLAGGRLLTGGATGKAGFARISDEVVVAQNPDVIIGVPHGSTEDIAAMADYITTNEAWKSTNAFKNGRVAVSTENELLQAGIDAGAVIKSVRKKWLKN